MPGIDPLDLMPMSLAAWQVSDPCFDYLDIEYTKGRCFDSLTATRMGWDAPSYAEVCRRLDAQLTCDTPPGSRGVESNPGAAGTLRWCNSRWQVKLHFDPTADESKYGLVLAVSFASQNAD